MNRGHGGPVYFVHRGLDAWKDIMERDDPPTADDVADRLEEGRDVWIVSTWMTLKRRGLPVALVPKFVPDAMCVVHYDDLSPSSLPFNSYVVAVRADRDPAFICEAEILQNPSAAKGPHHHFVPHWPQPGLIPRHPERADRIETLGYMGRTRNLAYRFRSPPFLAELETLGISLVVREEPPGWRDYGEIDVVLAVRDGTHDFLADKPATKLVNAWHAGCPALAGSESAYRSLRTSPLDYLEVSSPEDGLRALTRLKDHPELYRDMARHGRERAAEFSREAVARRWEELLFQTLAPAFERWSGRSAVTRMARFMSLVVKRKAYGKRYTRGYDERGRESAR